ncbi:hypothetical protein ACHQM5_028192 [Ranunculus cassubicifolius]
MEKSIPSPKRVREEQQQKDDPASQLVGRIVEKGFDIIEPKKKSTTISFPRPSVIPFPVARHRSHGPHWAPLNNAGKMDVDDDEDEQVADSREDTDFDSIASFADPIQRKQKKSLDLSRWRELVNQDGSTVVSKQTDAGSKLGTKGEGVGNKGATNVEGKQVKRESKVSTSVIRTNGSEKEHVDDLVGNTTESPWVKRARDGVEDMRIDGPLQNLNSKHEHIPDSLNVKNLKREEGSVSLESQIDVENRAVLQNMSPEEIAEAQSEIMEKMNRKPGLLEMLKKRGRSKLASEPRTIPSDMEIGTQTDNVYNEKRINQDSENVPTLEKPKSQHVSAIKPSKDTPDVPNTNGVKTSDTKWNTWSRRVEAVRTLRFSLEGDVLEDRPGDGNTSKSNQISVDRIAERDFLRTEGDPGSLGYTIKEAVALSRSTVPGQRALALKLISLLLDKASCEIQQAHIGLDTKDTASTDNLVDWKAVWAYTLGPDPELALALRMALDDYHINVIFTALKVLHFILSCDINERFFGFSEKMATYEKVMCTAPIFRSRPGIEGGFLQGGFWKYNTKPSSILSVGEEIEDSENEANRTIQDDVVMAGQDFAAGLIRMGIIPRVQHLLVTDANAAMEEHLINLLICLARHSPTSANAIIKLPELVQTIVDRFIMKDTLEINESKIKSMTLLKVLAQSDKKVCISFIEKGVIQNMMWHFYRHPLSFEQWIKSGRDYCKLMSALMVEQLRLWRVCIQYGYCISYFTDFFPVLCLWLSPPTFDRLVENNLLEEFSSIAREAYLVLESLARTLPDLHSEKQLNKKSSDLEDTSERWLWSHVSPMVDSALKWISLEYNPYLSKIINCHEKTAFSDQDSSMSSIMWVISAVVHMLSSILKKVALCDRVPWIPEFVPKIGIELIKNRFLDFFGTGRTLTTGLCHLRLHCDFDLSLSSVSCLNGIVQLIVYLDKSIQSAKQESSTPYSGEDSFSREGKILEDGIFQHSRDEIKSVLITFMTTLDSSWQKMQFIETFGRGGPAPGVGLGWGASGGGFWSTTILLEQAQSLLLMELFEMFRVGFEVDHPSDEEVRFTMQRVNSALGVCLVVGPRDTYVLEKALDFLLEAPVLKYLDISIRNFVSKRGSKSFAWVYREDDYQYMGNILSTHFRNRWLSIKKKANPVKNGAVKKDGNALGTIYEDSDTSHATCTSMVIEWAHQRLPLPIHWFLSPISTINEINVGTDEVLEVAKSGIFFLLGLESCTSEENSPVGDVPLIWKLHSLSAVLLVGMGVLHDEKNRDLYSVLQDFYGHLLNESRRDKKGVEFLKFQSDIHQIYTTFIDNFVEQFGAESYGDLIYGRQVSLYLHGAVEVSVRLATWNALSSAHVLELLPSLEDCFAQAEGYLETEENEGILEAYAKSWVSGGLDKAVLRGSMTYKLAMHHLSTFIFQNEDETKLPLKNKLAKSLLRDLSRKQKHEGMMLDLIRYKKPDISEELSVQKGEIERRLRVLAEACEGNSTLLPVVEKLKSSPKLV